jgi:hypothetical protein
MAEAPTRRPSRRSSRTRGAKRARVEGHHRFGILDRLGFERARTSHLVFAWRRRQKGSGSMPLRPFCMPRGFRLRERPLPPSEPSTAQSFDGSGGKLSAAISTASAVWASR